MRQTLFCLFYVMSGNLFLAYVTVIVRIFVGMLTEAAVRSATHVADIVFIRVGVTLADVRIFAYIAFFVHISVDMRGAGNLYVGVTECADSVAV